MIRFGPFALDPVAGRLFRRGVEVPLPAQPLRVLGLLAARPGRLVTREELRAAVWPDGTDVDVDRGLNFCVNRMRRALADDARRPVYVETLPGRGYRFIAAVSDTAAAAPTASAAAPAAPPARRPATALVATGLLALALIAAASARVRPVAEGAGPRDAAARVAYVRGLYQARVANDGPRALAALDEAARLAPGDAAVQAALAEAWLTAVAEGRASARDGMPRARDAAARAAALGEDAGALAVLGTVALRFDWDWDQAESFLRRSLRLRPNVAATHLELADLLLVRGHAPEALDEARRAEELDPVCPSVNGRLAASYYAARRFGEAAEAWRQAAGVVPESIGPHEKLFHALRHADRPHEALREAAQVMALVGRPPGPEFLDPARSARGIEAFLSGTIEYLRDDAARRPSLFADRLGALNAALGRRAEALRWLDVAARERAPALPVTLATDPDLDLLRGDPAFRDLMRRLRLS